MPARSIRSWSRSLHRLNFSQRASASRNWVRSRPAIWCEARRCICRPGRTVAEQMLPVLEQRGLIGQGGYGPRAGGHGEGWRAYLLPPSDQARYFLGNADTPLWYYVLQEASVFGTGDGLIPSPRPMMTKAMSAPSDFRPHRGPRRPIISVASICRAARRPYRRGTWTDADGGYQARTGRRGRSSARC